jgi:hypothetical protein
MQPPREHDRKSYLVQLNASPVGLPIYPRVLRKSAILLLNTGEIDKRPQRCNQITCGQQPGCAVDHVARPHQMIAAQILVPMRLAPGNAQRRDQGAAIVLVFMRQYQFPAAAIKLTAIAAEPLERMQTAADPLPLLEKACAVLWKRGAQRLRYHAYCAMDRVTEAERDSKMMPVA